MLDKLLMKLRAEYREPKYRLFVDMDGTVVEWKAAEEFEDLYEKGYFASLQPYQNVVDAIRLIFQRTTIVEIYTLSAVLPDSPYSIPEKMEWLDRHMPFIPMTTGSLSIMGLRKWWLSLEGTAWRCAPGRLHFESRPVGKTRKGNQAAEWYQWNQRHLEGRGCVPVPIRRM